MKEDTCLQIPMITINTLITAMTKMVFMNKRHPVAYTAAMLTVINVLSANRSQLTLGKNNCKRENFP